MLHKITAIHNSPLFGEFIEIGCGQPLAQLLFSVSGASKTVYLSESPYSKVYYHNKYGSVDRAISKEATERIISAYVPNEYTNFTFASSFQVGTYNDISTHGWISINDRNVTKSYHISIHESLSRTEYIDIIAKVSLDIVYSHLTSEKLDSTYIDDYGTNTLDIFCNHTTSDNILVFNNGVKRLEDVFRDKKNIIIYKGSFNPPQIAHQTIIEETMKKYPNSGVAFMINVNTYDKGEVDCKELEKRIKYINALGYAVLIQKDGYFSSAANLIRKKFKQPIVFPVGWDTLVRLLDTYDDSQFANCELLYMKRNINTTSNLATLASKMSSAKNVKFIELDIDPIDISSTQIRQWIEDKNYEKIKEYVSPKLITLL